MPYRGDVLLDFVYARRQWHLSAKRTRLRVVSGHAHLQHATLLVRCIDPAVQSFVLVEQFGNCGILFFTQRQPYTLYFSNTPSRCIQSSYRTQ